MFSLPIIAPPTRGGGVCCLTSYPSSTVRGKKLKGQSSKRKSIRGPKKRAAENALGENITGNLARGKATARRIALHNPPEWNHLCRRVVGRLVPLVRDKHERNRLSRHCQVPGRANQVITKTRRERNPERGAGRQHPPTLSLPPMTTEEVKTGRFEVKHPPVFPYLPVIHLPVFAPLEGRKRQEGGKEGPPWPGTALTPRPSPEYGRGEKGAGNSGIAAAGGRRLPMRLQPGVQVGKGVEIEQGFAELFEAVGR